MKNIVRSLCLIFICSFCWADSVTFTTQTDWESGSLNAVQTKMSPGDLILGVPNPIPAEQLDANTFLLTPLDADTNTANPIYAGNCLGACFSCPAVNWNTFGSVSSTAQYKSVSGSFDKDFHTCNFSNFSQGTIQFWVDPSLNITTSSGQISIIFLGLNSVMLCGWNNTTSDGKIQFKDANNNIIATTGKTNWLSGQWYHVLCSWKPASAKLWVDRELVQTSSTSFSFMTNGPGYSYMTFGNSQIAMDDLKISSSYKDIFGPFASSGIWQSQVQVFNSVAISPVVISWNADVPGGTNLQLQARVSSDGINFTSWFTVVQGQKLTSDPTQKYIQIQALFTTSDSTLTPNLHDITLANSPTNQPPINQAIVYPNPFRFQAGQPVQLAINLNYPAEVKIKIYDSSENVVYSSDKQGGLGNNLYTWNPQGIANGVYFVQFTVNDQQIVKKVVIIK